jgi:hypothetical protein
MDNNISFSKIVATPTLNSWSQAYNAGKLFAVLSLEKTNDLPETESLNMIGKDLLERLEQEFFVIEDKNLESIKNAVSAVFAKTIGNIDISFAAGTIINNILYLFTLGNSKIFIKRDGNLGMLPETQDADPKSVFSSSGFLKESDLIVLATDAFSQVISRDNLNASLNDNEPAQITESLAPEIHKSENGKISAIIIKYTNPQPEPIADEGVQVSEETKQEETTEEKSAPGGINPLTQFLSKIKSKLKKPNIKILPKKTIFLILTIIIVCILVSGVFLGIQEQNNAKTRTLFAQIYPQAQKKYDEGQSLVNLNKNYARDAFLAAQKILNDNLAKFPPKSKESIQAQDLLEKIDTGLAQFSPVDKSGLDRSKLSITVENGSGTEGVAGKAADALKTLGYNIVSTGNADNFNYQGITIKVKSASGNFINLLKQDLSKDYAITASSSDLSSDSPTDALIIIGK